MSGLGFGFRLVGRGPKPQTATLLGAHDSRRAALHLATVRQRLQSLISGPGVKCRAALFLLAQAAVKSRELVSDKKTNLNFTFTAFVLNTCGSVSAVVVAAA